MLTSGQLDGFAVMATVEKYYRYSHLFHLLHVPCPSVPACVGRERHEIQGSSTRGARVTHIQRIKILHVLLLKYQYFVILLDNSTKQRCTGQSSEDLHDNHKH